MKLILTLEGDIQRILDILGLLLTEDYQDYITDLKTEEPKQ
jgi:hypothetical protein